MIRRVTSVITPGTEEPVSVADMQSWSRGTIGSDTASIQMLITACRSLFERITGRELILKTNTIMLDTIPGSPLPWWQGTREGARMAEQGSSIDLINPPVLTIESISTFDVDNSEIAWEPENYYLDNSDQEQIPRICLNLAASWPTNLRARNSLKIVVTAGYGDDAPMPPDMKLALMMMVLYMSNNRGDCSEEGACACGAMAFLRNYVLADVIPQSSDGRPKGLHSSFDGAFDSGY